MKISIYIHIPFCVRKCLYCDFLSGPFDEGARILYIDALCREIENSSRYNAYSIGGGSREKESNKSLDNRECFGKDYEVCSIFLGGGTPSLLSDKEIERILDCIYRYYRVDNDCEISMELNPGTVESKSVLEGYKIAGVNRLSIGLQSALDEELELLGRIHRLEDFRQSYEMAVAAGFTNINVDLISGLPGQTLEAFGKSLEYLTGLGNELKHISVYSLIVEEGTPFYDMHLELPSEETDREIYALTKSRLEEAGFTRYEISNYAKEGHECRHNKVYWERGNYIGFGLGASSMTDNIRWKNISDMEEYTSSMKADELVKKEEYHVLSKEEQMEEFMFLGLRECRGISIGSFEEYFKEAFPEKYRRAVDKYIKMGMICIVNKDGDERVMLTDEGINVSNVILSDFLF